MVNIEDGCIYGLLAGKAQIPQEQTPTYAWYPDPKLPCQIWDLICSHLPTEPRSFSHVQTKLRARPKLFPERRIKRGFFQSTQNWWLIQRELSWHLAWHLALRECRDCGIRILLYRCSHTFYPPSSLPARSMAGGRWCMVDGFSWIRRSALGPLRIGAWRTPNKFGIIFHSFQFLQLVKAKQKLLLTVFNCRWPQKPSFIIKSFLSHSWGTFTTWRRKIREKNNQLSGE